MWKKHNFETIFTYDDVMNIQDAIGKGFGSIEIAIYVRLNDYFDPIIINRPRANPNYGPGQSKFQIDYYRQTLSIHFS